MDEDELKTTPRREDDISHADESVGIKSNGIDPEDNNEIQSNSEKEDDLMEKGNRKRLDGEKMWPLVYVGETAISNGVSQTRIWALILKWNQLAAQLKIIEQRSQLAAHLKANSCEPVHVGRDQGGEHQSSEPFKNIDLNTTPAESIDESGEEERSSKHVGISQKYRSKEKMKKNHNTVSLKLKDLVRSSNYKKSKRTENAKSTQSSPNNSNTSISTEIIKTKTIGAEVGFQLEGFEHRLRSEIEGEGALISKK
ncbi:hypothetical protein L1887_04335 [Cichorium endivia]|nr:hypothetical protein L1887_04335 [Cichorium endivia]